MTPRDKSAPRAITDMTSVVSVLVDIRDTRFTHPEDVADQLDAIRAIIEDDTTEATTVQFEELDEVIAFLETD